MAYCRAARLPAIVAAARDTEAVPSTATPGPAHAGLSAREFVLHARGTPAAKSTLARTASPQSRATAAAPLAARAAGPARRSDCDHVVLTTPRRTPLIGAVIFLPGADMPVMTINQLKHGPAASAPPTATESGPQRTVEMLGVVGTGFG